MRPGEGTSGLLWLMDKQWEMGWMGKHILKLNLKFSIGAFFSFLK